MLIKDCFELPLKLQNYLIKAGIDTTEKLEAYPKDELGLIPGIRDKSVVLIEQLLRKKVKETELKITPNEISLKNTYE